jgi:tetratricopeptide (TPR) repeat protein
MKRCSIWLISAVIFLLPQPLQAQRRVTADATVMAGRDLTVGRDLILGLTKVETQDLIDAVLKNEYRERINQIAVESKLSTDAVRAIFRTVVGRETDDTTTIQEQVFLILHSWVEVKARLEQMGSDDDAVANLRNLALAALNNGNRAEAERLLLEATKRAVESAKVAQETAYKRLRDAAVSSADLAQLNISNLRFKDAAQRYHEAAEFEPPTNLEDKCGYLVSASDAAFEAGDYDGANELLKEAMTLAQQHPGVQFAAIQARVEHRFAKVALARGDGSTAGELLLGALGVVRLFPEHSKLDEADILEDLAVKYWNESKFKDTRESLQQAADLVLKDESPRALVLRSEALNTEGGLLADMGEFAAAEEAMLEGLNLRRRLFSDKPLSPRIIDSENNLGFLYRQWGRLDDADQHLRKAESAAHLIFGDEHITTSVIEVNRAILACNMGKFDQALKLINIAQGIRDKKIGKENLLSAFSLDVKGMILLHTHDLIEARLAIISSYKTRAAILRDPDLSLVKSHLAVSALDLAEGNAQEAKSEADAALSMLLKLFGPDHPLAGLAFYRLSQAFSALHDQTQATEFERKAAQVKFPTSDCDL